MTGDNTDTASQIAKECGILTEGGLVMDGPTFRKLTPAQLDAVLPTLQVLNTLYSIYLTHHTMYHISYIIHHTSCTV
ncbi:hypothetical protein EON63_23325 [archaeon]|nr:MAG: hypothetical protein EON63_23325 [archaeon]